VFVAFLFTLFRLTWRISCAISILSMETAHLVRSRYRCYEPQSARNGMWWVGRPPDAISLILEAHNGIVIPLQIIIILTDLFRCSYVLRFQLFLRQSVLLPVVSPACWLRHYFRCAM